MYFNIDCGGDISMCQMHPSVHMLVIIHAIWRSRYCCVHGMKREAHHIHKTENISSQSFISRSAALHVQMLSVVVVVRRGQLTKSQLSLHPDHLEGWFSYQNGVEFNFQ